MPHRHTRAARNAPVSVPPSARRRRSAPVRGKSECTLRKSKEHRQPRDCRCSLPYEKKLLRVSPEEHPRKCRAGSIITCTIGQVGRLSSVSLLPTSGVSREACNPQIQIGILYKRWGFKEPQGLKQTTRTQQEFIFLCTAGGNKAYSPPGGKMPRWKLIPRPRRQTGERQNAHTHPEARPHRRWTRTARPRFRR